MDRCKTCKHWNKPESDYGEVPGSGKCRAVESKIRVAVADKSNQWGADEYIKEQVKAQWQTAVDAMILDANIAAELERKIRAQLAAAMKAVGLCPTFELTRRQRRRRRE